MPAVAPVPQHYIRWVDPETNRVVRMERVEGDSPEVAERRTRLAVAEYIAAAGGV